MARDTHSICLFLCIFLSVGYAFMTIIHADVVSSLCTGLPLHLYFAPFGLGYVKLLHSFELSEDT